MTMAQNKRKKQIKKELKEIVENPIYLENSKHFDKYQNGLNQKKLI